MGSMSDIGIRKAEPSDLEAIADVYLESRRHFLPFAPLTHTDDGVRQWIAKKLVSKSDTEWSVARVKGKVAGVMALRRSESSGWIDQLYVHPRAVGRGIGTQFVERAKGTLGSPIRLYTFQANCGACRFYERHGFKAIEFSDGSGNEEKCPDVLYEWREKTS